MLCAPVFMLSSFRAPTLWYIDLTVATWHIQLHFSELMLRREYSKSAFFVWHENGRRRLLGAQSINSESFSISAERSYVIEEFYEL